ncbi:hypothetical protein CJ030_MR2G027109 [Morella rubra]|uniref:Uncharacterized protein n=1 Tax=Morella rubra TaxID=262757 RepID=A0A6A1WCZ1_9ROSI|nr:hypothetical protein CJ030_MR2G027109 [Morella rubra]
MAWMLSLKALLVLTSVVFVAPIETTSMIQCLLRRLQRRSRRVWRFGTDGGARAERRGSGSDFGGDEGCGGGEWLCRGLHVIHVTHVIDVHFAGRLVQARLKNLVDKDAEEKSDAATEALLQELVVDAEETKKGVAILLLMVEMILNWRLIGLLGSTDELNQQEEELRAEFEEVERKLEETLELQRRMENDAKQKRLAEQNDNVED